MLKRFLTRLLPTPAPAVKPSPLIPFRRLYAAVVHDRLTEGWQALGTSANVELNNLHILRNRSRAIVRDYPHAGRFIGLLHQNVVGPNGIKLQAQIKRGKRLDTSANDQIETEWESWASNATACDLAEQWPMKYLLRQILTAWATDGECFIILNRGLGSHGLKLQVVEADHLDHRFNTNLSHSGANTDSIIRMGIELAPSGERLAYWFYSNHPGDLGVLTPMSSSGIDSVGAFGSGGSFNTSYQRVRVPADQVIHVRMPGRAGQHRGEPPMHAVLLQLYHLGKYTEAEVVAARVGACKQGFIIPDNSNAQYTGDREESNGQVTEEVAPGIVTQLPPGARFESFDPQHPNAGYAEFVKAMLRSVGAGLGVSAHNLTGDMTDVNYSSARIAELAERDGWMALQNWLIDTVLTPVYAEWLRMSILTGRVSLPESRRVRDLHDVRFMGRRWAWVDPQKEINARLDALRAGLATWDQTLIELGLDPEDTLNRLKENKKSLQDAGLGEIVSFIYGDNQNAQRDPGPVERPSGPQAGDLSQD